MNNIQSIANTILFVTPGEAVKDIAAYAVLILIFLFGAAVLIAIAKGTINISQLLDEHGGGASMSRFQLLVFTFLIALSFLIIVLSKSDFPDIPTNVLMLLGISASTYGVSKGIQATSDAKPKAPAKDQKDDKGIGAGASK